MVESVIQHSFHAGEWAPALYARVDLAKYKAGAALLENFYVDYRGGASSRPGTQFVAQAINSSKAVRLIPFQASNSVGYILEFGDYYMRPIFNGAPISFTLSTPYPAEDLALLKFTQLVDRMFLCHPNHLPNVLTIIAANNWTLNTIPFGSSIQTPTGLAGTTTNAGNGNYSYVVTAIDSNGQESGPSAVASQTINTTSGQVATIHLTWNAIIGAQSYNVYRTPESIGSTPPAGSSLGFLMNVTGTAADDTFTSNSAHNAADYSIGPPIPQNPFQGAGLNHITVTSPGDYTNFSVPSVTVDPPPSGGAQATAHSVVAITSATVVNSGFGFSVGQIGTGLIPDVGGSASLRILTVDGTGHVLTVEIINPDYITGGIPSAGPWQFGVTGIGFFVCSLTWGVVSVTIDHKGAGYTAVPNVVFSIGGPTATGLAILDNTAAGNPAVPGLHQQRLVLAARPLAVQSFNMSQPGEYYNFNISSPIQADDAIEGSIVSGQLNEIKSMISVPTGLVLLTNKANWLVSAGGGGGAVTPIDIVANAHSYNGANDVPPIVANFDVLFVQNKNSIVRDLTFNFYTQIYTGTDISVLSSHLFYGYQILEWAWAEEPFKVVWAVRDDGVALSLTFLKEQELIGWSHSVTDGLFKSVAVVTEPQQLLNGTGVADAVYFVVERVINGQTIKYIERLSPRIWPNSTVAFCVDAGLRYVGPPVTTFSGAQHLAGKTVTGLANGAVITPFVMPISGTFTLPAPASNVTIGLPFTCKLQTLPLDIGEPTIAGKRKGINGVTVRVQETLGLEIGGTFTNMVPMKDLVLGNVGSASNTVVTGLVTGDARTIVDPSWTVPGQYCIRQSKPLPATILGVIPEIEVGDTK